MYGIYTSHGLMTPADMADLADLYDWGAGEEQDPECEARGCDIPEGYTECRRCGAELVEESIMAKDMSPAERKAWEKAYGAKPGGLDRAVRREQEARDARAALKRGLESLREDRR